MVLAGVVRKRAGTYNSVTFKLLTYYFFAKIMYDLYVIKKKKTSLKMK